MENSPTGNVKYPILCQSFVWKPLEIKHKQFSQSTFLPFFYSLPLQDEFLLDDSNIDNLERMFEWKKKDLPCGLQIAS